MHELLGIALNGHCGGVELKEFKGWNSCCVLERVLTLSMDEIRGRVAQI